MIGLVIFTVILVVLAAAEAVGLYDQHTGHDPRWQPLTTYIRRAPMFLRWIVLGFCLWLVYHFAQGVVT